jgi:hypothetical protein
VAVRVVEVDATAAIEVIDPVRLLTKRIRVGGRVCFAKPVVRSLDGVLGTHTF